MWSLKRNDTNELTKQKETHRHREQTYGLKGRNGGYNLIRLSRWMTASVRLLRKEKGPVPELKSKMADGHQ